MLKRTVTLLLAVLMIAALAACNNGTTSPSTDPTAAPTAAATAASGGTESPGGEETAQSQWPLYEQLTEWNALANTFVNAPRSGEQLVYKTMEEFTNVKLNIEEGGSGADYTTKINLRMAAADAPHMVQTDVTTAQLFIRDGLIVELTPYMEQFGTHYVQELQKSPELYRNATDSDGKFWFIGKIRWKHDNTSLLINQPWMDELGLTHPTTADELTEVLRAFKAAKGDHIAPWTSGGWAGSTGVYTYAYLSFGTSAGFTLWEDGQYLYGPYEKQAETKAALQWLNQLYSEKLLDNEYLTLSNDDYVAKVRRDEVGMVYGWFSASTNHVDENGNPIVPTKTDWVTPDALKTPAGKQYTLQPGVLSSQMFITSSHPDPEKAVQYFDYYFTDEGCDLFSWGVEGVTYNVVNGERVFVDDILLAGSAMNAARNHGVIVEGWPMLQRDLIPGLYFQDIIDSIETNAKFWLPTQPVLAGSTDEEKEIANILVDVNKLNNESFAKFVAGELNFESDWDNYIKQMESFGIARVIELRQKHYQEWQAKY